MIRTILISFSLQKNKTQNIPGNVNHSDFFECKCLTLVNGGQSSPSVGKLRFLHKRSSGANQRLVRKFKFVRPGPVEKNSLRTPFS